MIQNLTIIISKISHYRIPLFEKLSKFYDVNLVHSEKEYVLDKPNLKSIYVGETKILGFIIHNKELKKVIKKADILICLFNIRNLSLIKYAFLFKRNFKLLYWGIGVSASTKNNSKFDEDKKFDLLRKFILKGADSAIFYTDYAKTKYVNMGVSADKLFVENNTIIYPEKPIISDTKNQILFIGSLYKQKGLHELIEAYELAFKKKLDIPKLVIIGTGDQLNELRSLSIKRGLSKKIEFKGEIRDPYLIRNEFSKSIVTISPNQAGLSILTSFAHGVPFVCRYDSITGGERLNITNNFNGIMYYSFNELIDIICDLSDNIYKYNEMGKNALIYYNSVRSQATYGTNFLKALEYVKEN